VQNIRPCANSIYCERCFWVRTHMTGWHMALNTIDQSSIGRHCHSDSILRLQAAKATKTYDNSPGTPAFIAILIIGAVACLLLMLQWGGIIYPWSNSKVWGTLLGFIFHTTCFVCYELRLGEKATVPLRLFRNRTIWSASLCAWCSVMIFYK